MPTSAVCSGSNLVLPARETLGRGAGALLLVISALAAPARSQTDFKLKVTAQEAGENATEDLLVHDGKLYRFRDRSKEVLVIDFAAQRIDLIDIAAQRRMRSSLTFEALDAATTKLKATVLKGIERREQEGGKANLIAAQMARSLIEPRLTERFDSRSSTLRLSGDRVEITGSGVGDPDQGRLDLLVQGLSLMARLDWVRIPEGLPPETELGALQALVKQHRLRPRELSIVYQLAGDVRKDRWTFELAGELTERDVEALARLAAFRPRAVYFSFSRYESRGPH